MKNIKSENYLTIKIKVILLLVALLLISTLQVTTAHADVVELGHETFANETCPECLGNETVTCTRCDGSGKTTCYKCKGTGDVEGKCDACNGRGEVYGYFSCSDCDGTGECQLCPSSGVGPCVCNPRGVCNTCDGKGKEWRYSPCEKCDADGILEGSASCETCSGRGNVTCSRCDGLEVEMCPTCDGDGEVYVPETPSNLKINYTNYEGGTKANPTQIYFDKDVSISWNIVDKCRITITGGPLQEQYDNTSTVTKTTLEAKENGYIVYTVKSENKESIQGESGAKALYYEIIIDTKAPIFEVVAVGSNDVLWIGSEKQFPLVILPEEVFLVRVKDDSDYTITYMDATTTTEYKGENITAKNKLVYKFVAKDKCGNTSTILIESNYPAPSIIVDGIHLDWGETEEQVKTIRYKNDVEISWQKTFNGKIFISSNKGEIELNGGADGEYLLTTDENSETTYSIKTVNGDKDEYKYYKIVIDKEKPTENYDRLIENADFHKTKYYKFNNMYYFEYENAEQAYVDYTISNNATKHYWDDVDIFAEVLADGEVAVKGDYYRYRYGSGQYKCYFEYDNLIAELKTQYSEIAVIEYYKGNSISANAQYEDMQDNVISVGEIQGLLVKDFEFEEGSSITATVQKHGTNESITAIYGESLKEQLKNVQGLYEIIETDEVGNEFIYYVCFDSEIEDFIINVDNYEEEKIDVRIPSKDLHQGVFYYNSFQINDVRDLDRESIVKVTGNDGVAYYNLTLDTIPKFEEVGTYEVEVYDRSSNRIFFAVHIGTESATVNFNERYKTFDIEISVPTLTKYTKIEILRNGELLTYDDENKPITNSVYQYSFSQEGKYEVIVVDSFGITHSYTYSYVAGKVSFEEINGISNGVANDDVVLKYHKDKGTLLITKNGEPYIFSETVDTENIATVIIDYSPINDGTYKAKLKSNYSDYSEFINEVNFTLKVDNSPNLVGVKNNGATEYSVYLTWNDDLNATATYRKDSEAMQAYKKNQKLYETGEYLVIITAPNGESWVYSFVILLNTEYTIKVNDRYVNSVDSFVNGSVKFDTTDKDLILLVKTEKGVKLDIKWGQAIVSEGKYVVTVIKSGGIDVIRFEIDNTPPKGVLDGVGNGGKTQNEVSLNWADPSTTATITKDDDKPIKYKKNEKITEGGKYTIALNDIANNETLYTFEIDRQVDAEVNIENGLITNSTVELKTNEDNLDIKVLLNNEEIETPEEFIFDKNGSYDITITDEFKNSKTMNFTIVSTPLKSLNYQLPQGYTWDSVITESEIVEDIEDSEINLNKDGIYSITYVNKDKGIRQQLNVVIDTIPPKATIVGVTNGGSTEELVIVLCDEENVTTKAIHEGRNINYKLGKEITGSGDYVVEVYDQAGNKTEFTFNRIWKINTAGKIAVVVMGLTAIGISIDLIRKRKVKSN